MSELTNVDHDAIWNIMNNFDFERTLRVMIYLNWTWNKKDLEQIPEIEVLRDRARQLLVESTSRARKVNGQYAMGSGGFFVYADYDSASNKVYVKLAFELAEWDNYE